MKLLAIVLLALAVSGCSVLGNRADQIRDDLKQELREVRAALEVCVGEQLDRE